MDEQWWQAQTWADMPGERTFDELIQCPAYRNYVECHGRWRIVLTNGFYYKQDPDDPEVGRLCRPLERLDPNLRSSWF